MRPLPSLTVLLCAPLTLAACGDDPVDPPEAKTITFNAARTELVAVQEEGGDWRALEPAADGTATAELSGPYTVASVCDTVGFFDYYTIQATPDDADVFEVWCWDDSIDNVNVTIDPAQVGIVYISYITQTAGDTASIRPGRYDLVAIDDTQLPPRVAFQRDVQLTADTTILIDVAADGVAMNPVTITPTGADSTTSSMRLTTDDGTWVRWGATENETFLVPPSLLVESDRQTVSASSGDGNAYRTASVVVDGDETTVSVALPAAITAASRTVDADVTATWTTTEAFADHYFYLANEDFSVLWDVMSFGGYVDEMGLEDTVTIADPTQIPGWNTAWNVATPSQLDWYLLLSTPAADGSSKSASWDSATLESRRAQVRPYAAAQRARAAQR